MNDAWSGYAHIDHFFRLAHSMESSGHKWIVFHCIAKHHQLCAADTLTVSGCFCRLFDDPPHQLHCIHVDAGLGRSHIDGGTYQISLRKCLRDGCNQPFICNGHTLLHQCRIAADKINPAGLCSLIQCMCKTGIIRITARSCYQSDRRHGDPLIDDWNTKLHLDLLGFCHQILCRPADLVVDLLTGFINIFIAAAKQRDTHRNRTDIQMLLLDHLNRRKNIFLI